MMNLAQLSVSQRLLVYRQRDIRIGLNVEVKDVVAEALGGAEGSEEEGCAEGLGRG
jgi:hypothetical protein